MAAGKNQLVRLEGSHGNYKIHGKKKAQDDEDYFSIFNILKTISFSIQSYFIVCLTKFSTQLKSQNDS